MADVAFDSNKHAQTRQDVEHGGAAIASSSEAITRLSNGQYERFWTDEAGPQALRNAFIAFLDTYGKLPLPSATLSAPSGAMSIKRSRTLPPLSRRRGTN